MANELQIKISTIADTQALTNTKNSLKSVEESSSSASIALKNIEDDMTSMMRRASEIYNQDPYQKHNQSLLELNTLYKNGLLDIETYSRAKKNLNEELKSVTGTNSSLITSFSSLNGVIGVLSFASVAYGIQSVVKSGIELSSQMESMKIGISALIAVNSQDITAMGKHIDASQKFAMAQKDSAEAVNLLRKANIETPATLSELTKGFQSALGPAMALGFSIQDTVKYSTLMTQAAAAMGMPMDQLSQEMRSILQGQIDNNSVVAKNIGLTNEQVKAHIKQGDIYPFLIGKLSDFGSAGKEMAKSWSGVTSNMEDAWDSYKMHLVNDSGIFDGAKKGIVEITNLIQNQDGELDTFIHYTKEAASATGAFYGVILLEKGLTALKEIEWATKIATVTQLSFNTAVSINPWVIVAGGIALAVAGLYEYRGLIQDIEKSQANVAGQQNFQKDLQTLRGKDNGQKISDVEKRSKEVHDAEVATLQEIEKRKGYAYQGSKNDDIVDNLKKRQSALHAEQESLLKLHESLLQVKKDRTDTLVAKPPQKDEKEEERLRKKAEAEAKKAEAKAEKLKQDYLSIDKDIASFGDDEHDKAIANINDKVEHYRKAGIDQVKLAELKTAMLKKLEDDETKEELKKEEEKRKTIEDYYTTIGDFSSAFYMKEADKMQKLAQDNILSSEQMMQIYEADTKKFEADEAKRKKDQWDKDNKGFIDLMTNVNKAMDEQFFNVMSGKFTSFGNWLKDLWGSITQSLERGLSKTLADSILGTGTGVEGGIVNLFKNFGGFSGSMGSSAGLVGTTLSADNITSLGGEIGKAFTTSAGTSVDANGVVSAGGTDLSGVLNLASNLKSIYGLATNGIEATLYAPAVEMSQLAGTAYSAGFTGVGNFLAGSTNVLAGGGVEGLSGAAVAGGLLTAGVMGGVGGYALGSLGDKLFGTDTKAGTYGAAGGAIGAVVGSVVPVVGTVVGAVVGSVLGSVIGGAFGSSNTSISGTGVRLNSTASANSIDAQHYTSTHEEKSSWFGSSSSDVTYYGAFTAGDIENYKNTFAAYNFLLKQLNTSGSVTVAAGQYTYDGFNKALTQGFIHSFNANLNQIRLDSIYNDWVAYATSVNKTVQQAMADSVTTYISETRSFSEWKMGSGTQAQLKFTSDYMASDLAQLESQMGVSGVNKDNFLSSYQGAIKDNFTAETIDAWKKLGDAIQASSDANQKYADSLKQTADAANALRASAHTDMMLSRTSDVSGVIGGTSGTVTKAMLDALTTLVSEAKRQTTLAQLSAGRA